MGAHFTDAEPDTVQKMTSEKATPVDIHARLVKDRERRRQNGPVLTTVRSSLEGDACNRSGGPWHCSHGCSNVLTRFEPMRLSVVGRGTGPAGQPEGAAPRVCRCLQGTSEACSNVDPFRRD